MDCLQVRCPPATFTITQILWKSSNVAMMNSEDDKGPFQGQSANLFPSVLCTPPSLHDLQGQPRSNGATDAAPQDDFEEVINWNIACPIYQSVLSRIAGSWETDSDPPLVSGYDGGTMYEPIDRSLNPGFSIRITFSPWASLINHHGQNHPLRPFHIRHLNLQCLLRSRLQ